jgi:membrane fusion protein (multidrug efflux system)
MKKIVSILIIVGISALIIIQLSKNKTDAENRVYLYDKDTPIPVFGNIISEEKQTQNKSYSGIFESMNEVKVTSDVQGKITEIYVKEGQKVTMDQPLVKIDNAMLLLQAEIINTKIDGLKKDEVRYKNLLLEDAIPAISLEKTQNGIETLEAEKKTIQEQINKSTVRAPFDGVISISFCEKGSFASPAIPLFEIINATDLKFVINVSEEDLDLFTNKTTYKIQSSYSETTTFKAKLNQVGEKGGIGNSFKIEFFIEGKTKELRPKMIGNLSITTQSTEQKFITIPSSAILGSDSNPEVYLVKNGKAIRTPILILNRNRSLITIKKGIKIGDTLITGGFINLFDNVNVSINKK